MTSPTDDSHPDIIPAPFRKKRGPKTDKGRAAVAMNAARHGLASDRVPIPGIEDPEAWAAFREAIIEDACPVGARQEAVVERIAQLMWRQNRVAAAEAEAIAVYRELVDDDFAARHSWGRNHPPDAEARASIAAAEDAMAAATTRGGHVRFVSESAGHEFVAALVDADDALAETPLAGFEEGLRNVPEGEWDSATMQAAVLAMAAHLKTKPAALLTLVVERLEARRRKYGEDLQRYLREKDLMSRERTLPPEGALSNIMKYEAHIGRQLAQANHDLAVLKSTQTGRPIPVTNFHVSTGS